MRPRLAFCILLLSVSACASAQQPVPPPAQRYLDILAKRPQPGTIFERFYAAWLEESTAVELREFLIAKAGATSASASDHLILAIFHAHRGDDREALASYDKALQLDPANAGDWIERSRIEARTLDFTAALASLEKAATAKPDTALSLEIGKLKGRALLRLGNNDEALRIWKDLATAHAEDEDLMEDLIDLFVDEGQYEAALASARTLVQRSRDPVAKTLRQLRLADILLLAERRDEALKTLGEALAATGADTWIEGDVLSRLSRVFRMNDDVSGLEKHFEALVQTYPQRAALGWQHTLLLGETGQKDAALQSARALLQSNPGRRDLREGFLDLLESLDLIQEAVAQAQALAAQNTGDKELLIRLASLQHRAQDDAAAQGTLETFLAIPGVGEADYLRTARLLENWEPPLTKTAQPAPDSPAAKAYARLVEKFPGSISAHEAQAHYLHRVGRRDEALAIWSRLAKTAVLEDLLRIGQALQARLESRTALDVLTARESDFATEPRFLTLLVQTAIANKELERALPLARARLRLMKDAEGIETALKDCLLIFRGEEQPLSALAQPVLQELQGSSQLAIQDRCLLAALLNADGKQAAAEKTLADAPAEDLLIALSQLAQLYQTRQDWPKAAEILQRVIELPAARTTARVQRLVDLLRRSEKPDQALVWIAEWKKLSPSAVQPWLEEARLLVALGRQTDALSLLRTATRKFADNVEVASAYATACLESGQAEEAERIYLSLYEKSTDATARLRLLGPLALAAQSHDGMPRLIEIFQQRQKQNRASAQPWLAMAELQRASGNDEERRRCLYEASRLRPQDIDLLHDIARSEEEVGLTAEALRTLESAAKLDKTAKTREHIARLQIESGDADLGYRMLYELAGGNQMDARTIEQIADTICEKGEWERVLTFLEPLLPKHPRDYRLHYIQAIALEEAGREKDAVRAFMDLLSMHEELPSVIAKGRGIRLREQFAARHLPPGVEDWLVLPGMMQYAYGHRQKMGQRSGRGYLVQQANYGMPLGFVEHPPSVADSPVLALAHLLQIAGGWDALERAQLVPQLTQAGVSDAALLLEAAENSPQLLVTPEMLLAHPENVTLHAVWLSQTQSGDPAELLPVYENAWKLFQTTDPSLARSIAQRAWAVAGEQSGPWLQRIFDIIEATPKPDAATFNSIASLLQGDGTSGDPRLKPEEVTRIADRLLGWYRAKTPTDGYYVPSILGALSVAKNWQGIVEVLRTAITVPKNPTAAAAPTPAISMNRYRGSSINVLVSQPQPYMLPLGLQLNVASLLQVTSFSREDVPAATLTPQVSEMRDGLRPFIAKADDPRLKFILQLICAEEAAIAQDYAARLQAKDVSADDFLTAGWLAQRANKPTEAIAHFTQALKLTTDAQAKSSIENAILFHAQRFIRQEQDESKTAPVRAQAKALLDEHLQQAKSNDAKYQIANIMEGIGLQAEAQAIQEAVQASQNRLSASMNRAPTVVANPYSRNRSYGQRQQQKSPEQLVQEGKTDLAIKEFTRQMRAAIQQTLSPQNGTSGHQQLHQVILEANKLKLWDQVAKVLRDAAANGWRPRLEYAVMLEHIGNSSEPAQAEHRAVLAANPHAYDSRVRLAVLLSYEGRFDEAVVHWRAVPAMLQEQHLPAIIQEFTQRHQFAVPKPDALSGLLCTWLKGLEPNRGLSMNVVQQFQQTLQIIEQADGQYPSLYQSWQADPLSEERQRWKLKPDGTLDLDEANTKNRATRRQAHDDLCRAMLAVPELAWGAFPPLAGLALEDGDAKAISELEATALDLLTSLTTPKVKRRLLSTGYSNLYLSNSSVVFRSSGRIFMPDAALFLVRAAALRKDTHMLDDTLYPLLTRVQGTPRTTFMKGYGDLLMAKEDSFVTVAENWLNQPQQQSYAINNRGAALDEVLRLWLERKIAAPLDALYTPKSSADRGYDIPRAVTAYAMALGQRNPESMRQFVRKVRDQWLGDAAEARHEAITGWITAQNDQRSNNNYYHQPSVKEQAANAYIQWLQSLMQQSRGLALLEIALEDGLDASPGWLRQIAYQHTSNDRLKTPEDFISSAEVIGFLGDAARFRAYDLTEGDQRSTWLGNLVRQFRERYGDAQINATLAQLGKRKPTFGSDLVQALLLKNSGTSIQLDGKPVTFEAEQVARFQNRSDPGFAFRGAALALVLMRHEKELASIPPLGQHELSTLLRDELGGYPQSDKLGEDLTRILTPLLKTENAELIRKVDQVLAAKTWNDLGQQEYEFTAQFPALLNDVARLDPAKAEAASRHAVELLRNSPNQKQAEAQSNDETPVGRFLHTLAQTPQLLPVVFELAEAEGVTRSASWRSHLCSRLEQMAQYTNQAVALCTNTPFVADTMAFRDLPDMDRSVPTIIAHIVNAIESDSACAKAVREHLTKQPATFGSELLLAFLHRDRRDDRRALSFNDSNGERPDDSALLAFIERRSADFSQLQPETAVCLWAMLNARMPDLGQKMVQNPALQQNLQPLVAADARQFEAEITRLLATSNFGDRSNEVDETTQQGVRLLDRLAQTDKPRAITLLDHLSKLVAQYDASSNRGGRPNPPHQTQVAGWLQRAAEVPELFAEIEQRAEECGAAKDARWLQRTLGQVQNIYKHEGKPQRVIALMEGLGMLNPAATFNPRPLSDDRRQRTLLESWFDGLRYGGHPGLAEELAKRQPQTLGVGIVLLYTSGKSSADVVAFAQAHAAEIAAASPEQKKMLSAFFQRQSWVDDIAPYIPALSEEFAPFVKNLEAFVEALLKTTKWEEIEGVSSRSMAPVRSDPMSRERADRTPQPPNSGMRPRADFYPPGRPNLAIDNLAKQLVQLSLSNPGMAREGLQHIAGIYRTEFPVEDENLFRKPPLDSFFKMVCASPPLAATALRFAANTRQRGIIHRFASSEEPWTEKTLIDLTFSSASLASAEKTVAMLDQTGLLASAAAFDPVPLPAFEKQSLLELVLWKLATQDAAVRAQTALLLTDKPDAVFGRLLLAALLGTKDSAEKKHQFDRCAAQFAQVRQESAGAILEAFTVDFPALGKIEQAEQAVDELSPFAPLVRLRDAEEKAYLNAVLAEKPRLVQPYRGHLPVINQEITRLMNATKPDEAVNLVRALRLQLEPQAAAATFGKGGYQRDGEKLSGFLRYPKAKAGQETALLACQFQAAARLPEMRMMSERGSPVDFVTSGEVLFREWESRGGWAAPAAVFDTLVRDLAKMAPLDNTIGLWLPLLHDALMHMGPQEQQDLANWAAQQTAAELKTVATELKLAKTLIDATEPLVTESHGARLLVASSSASEETFTLAAKTATALLGDEKIAPHVRSALAAFLTAIYPALLDETTRQTWGEAAAKAWHDGTPITRFEIETLLNAAAVLPMNETWQRTSDLVLQRWHQRELIMKEDEMRYVESGFHPFVMRFAARSEADLILTPMLAKRADDIRQTTGILLESGDWRHATEERIRFSYDLPSSFHREPRGWLPPTAETLKVMQSASTEDALLAEVLALDTNDAVARALYPQQRWQPRDQRFEAFAKKLASTPLPEQAVQRAHTLVALGIEHTPSALALLPQFDAVGKVFMSDSLPDNQAGMRCWTDLLAIHAALELARGNFTLADTQLQRLRTDPAVVKRYNSSTASLEADFRHTFFFCLTQLWQAGMAREPAKIAHLEVLKNTEPSSDPRFSVPTLKFALDTWQSVLKNEPTPANDATSKLQSQDHHRLVIALACAIAGSGKHRLSFQQRLQLFTRIASQTNLLTYRSSAWDSLLQQHFFEADELLRQRDAIVSGVSMLPRTHLDAIAVFLRRHGAYDTAAAIWEIAAKQPANSISYGTSNRYLLDRATMLIRLKQFKEARDCLDKFNDTGKTTFNLRNRDALMKLLPVPAK